MSAFDPKRSRHERLPKVTATTLFVEKFECILRLRTTGNMGAVVERQNRSLRVGTIAMISFLFATAAQACDPNEECNRCLASAFGRCQLRGNDPACEARKKACQVPVVGPLVTLPGTPLGPGGVLGPGGPGVGPISGEHLKTCIARPGDCPKIVLTDTFYAQLAPIVDEYIQYLQRQGNGRWQGIPQELTGRIRPFYPEINLNSVRFATNVNTLHGKAITIGNEIFFPWNLDLYNNANDQKLLFHELEHVVQYQRRGGVRPFLAEYIAKIPGKVISQRSFQIHDQLDIEQAAIAKAEQVSRATTGFVSAAPGTFGAAYGNFCNTPVGRFGPGPMNFVGAQCYADTPWGRQFGQISQ